MPDTIKISELDEALAIADAAEFPYTQENGGELTTFKAPLTQIAAKVVEDMSYAGINLPVGAGVKSVENTLNYLLGAVGGNPNENIAPEYDPTATYAKGDYVITKMYCTFARTPTAQPAHLTLPHGVKRNLQNIRRKTPRTLATSRNSLPRTSQALSGR